MLSMIAFLLTDEIVKAWVQEETCLMLLSKPEAQQEAESKFNF